MWMKKQPETETDVELQAGMKNETQAGVQTETENEMQTDMKNSREFICRFRFEKPVFVDEKLQIQARTERGKQIYECKREDREIVWNMQTHYTLPDRRDDVRYEAWNKQAEEFEKLLPQP